jgi:hypothetical protein
MTDLDPADTKNLDRYGSAPLAWSRARELMAAGQGPHVTYFLGTCRPDGTPHAAGVGALWLDGDLYFTSSPAARKARDLSVNPLCTISVQLPGIDVVLDGSARRVADAELLERVASAYRADGWPAEVDGDGLTAPFSAPSAGAPPWQAFRFVFRTAVGVASREPHGATRWRFDRG